MSRTHLATAEDGGWFRTACGMARHCTAGINLGWRNEREVRGGAQVTCGTCAKSTAYLLAHQSSQGSGKNG